MHVSIQLSHVCDRVWVWCGSPITTQTCVSSEFNQRRLHSVLWVLIRTCSCFLTSRHLHFTCSALRGDAYAFTHLRYLFGLLLSTMQLPSTSWSPKISQTSASGYIFLVARTDHISIHLLNLYSTITTVLAVSVFVIWQLSKYTDTRILKDWWWFFALESGSSLAVPIHFVQICFAFSRIKVYSTLSLWQAKTANLSPSKQQNMLRKQYSFWECFKMNRNAGNFWDLFLNFTLFPV